MKVHCSLIGRTFVGMAAASWWNLARRNSLRPKQPIPFHSTTALANPQNCRFYSEWRLAAEDVKRKFKGSSEYNEDESFSKNASSGTDNEYNHSDAGKNFPSVTADFAGKDDREYNIDEDKSLRASTLISRPRPQEVPWQKEPATVHFIGRIHEPVQFKHTQSGETFACTTFSVTLTGESRNGNVMWLTLEFWNGLAETAAQHLKAEDLVYVSGFLGLQTTAGEDDKFNLYKVTVTTLNLVEKRYPDFSQQGVVKKNTPSLFLSKQTVINGDPPLQYKKSQVESSNSGKYAQDSATTENLWHSFFNNPLEWWDNRTNKRNPKIPDFRHKDTGEALWIAGKFNPPWVKSQLAVLDSKRGILERRF